MYLLYADESGDTGLTASPTNYFILSGLVVHETRWRSLLDDIVAFRQHLRATKGLKLQEGIQFVIEDPFLKDSAHSFLHQLVDVVAYAARQLYEPNAYMRRKQGHNFYARLRPVLNPHANRAHALHLIQL